MSPIGMATAAPAVAVAATIAFSWLAPVAREARRERASIRAHARATRVYYAAIEAAEDDPSFSPDELERAVEGAIALAERSWRGRSSATERPDSPLITAWARSKESRLGRGLRVHGKPTVELLRVVNRPGETEDRVIARVRVRIHCKHPWHALFGVRHLRIDERWTLGRDAGRWRVLSVDGDPLTGPILTAPSIANRSFDDARLTEESLAEQANRQKVDDQVPLSELVSADEHPTLALYDLSVVDGRFLPALIAYEVAHLLEAWEEAVTGSTAPLEALASPDAITTLLAPAADIRFILRDATLRSWEPTGLHLSRQPPAIDIQVKIDAVRFGQTNDGRRRIGNDTERREIALTWTLELTGPTSTPWRLSASTNPARTVPGWPD
jgi:hypothetical protein